MEWGVTDLACRRGDAVVLRGVTFGMGAGRALVLRGPNGIGKTTLLRTLAGLTPPAGGRVDAPPETFAYGAHADGLKGQMSVAENLTFWAAAYATGPNAVARAVEAFDLGSLANRRAADLSAGQKRRTGLARMLVTGRPVWLLDEPTVSLDTATVARFADAVRAHLSGGGQVVIATHIDLGLKAEALDLTPFAARPGEAAAIGGDPFGEAVE